MPSQGSTPRLPPSLLLPLIGALVLAAAAIQPARAGNGASYVLPEAEGYGIGDCMRAGNACGKSMAETWCEAHGHAHALAYGSSDDITGAIAASEKVIRVADASVVIRCGD